MSLQPALGHTVTELGMLAVDPGHQGRGVGQALMAVVEKDERARGTQLLFAKVAWANRTSLRWYRKQGFTVAASGEAFLIHTSHGESSLVDLNDGHALVYKPMRPDVHILRKRLPADVSFLHLSNLPAHSQHGWVLTAAGS